MSPRSEAAALLDALAESQMALGPGPGRPEKERRESRPCPRRPGAERRAEIVAVRRRRPRRVGSQGRQPTARVKKANAHLNKILKEADRATTVARRLPARSAVARRRGNSDQRCCHDENKTKPLPPSP